MSRTYHHHHRSHFRQTSWKYYLKREARRLRRQRERAELRPLRSYGDLLPRKNYETSDIWSYD